MMRSPSLVMLTLVLVVGRATSFGSAGISARGEASKCIERCGSGRAEEGANPGAIA